MKCRVLPLLALLALVLAGCAAVPAGESAGPTETPAASQTDSPTASSKTVSVPATCDDLYNDEARELASGDGFRVLNPSWMSEPGNERKSENGYGTFDPQLAAQLSADPGLLCDWAKPSGGGEVFLTTQVREADAAAETLARDRIDALAWACSQEFGGTWCTTEYDNGGVLVGESHLFRDGLWVATNWAGSGPERYTEAVAETLFG